VAELVLASQHRDRALALDHEQQAPQPGALSM